MRKKYILKFKLPSGYEVRFSKREFTTNTDLAGNVTGTSIMVIGYVFKGRAKVGTCPGVITPPELSPEIIRQLFINHVQCLQDLAERKFDTKQFFLETWLTENPKYAYEYTMNLLGTQS